MKFFTLYRDGKPIFLINPEQISHVHVESRVIVMAKDDSEFDLDAQQFSAFTAYLHQEGYIGK